MYPKNGMGIKELHQGQDGNGEIRLLRDCRPEGLGSRCSTVIQALLLWTLTLTRRSKWLDKEKA